MDGCWYARWHEDMIGDRTNSFFMIDDEETICMASTSWESEIVVRLSSKCLEPGAPGDIIVQNRKEGGGLIAIKLQIIARLSQQNNNQQLYFFVFVP